MMNMIAEKDGRHFDEVIAKEWLALFIQTERMAEKRFAKIAPFIYAEHMPRRYEAFFDFPRDKYAHGGR